MPFRLRFGEILDAGYSEFMVTSEYAEILLNGGMTHVNGQPVRLQIVSHYLGHKIVRWTPKHEALELAA